MRRSSILTSWILVARAAAARRATLYYTIVYSAASSNGRLTRNLIIIIKCGFSWRTAATPRREKTLYNQITSNTIYVRSLRYVIARCSDEAKLTM